METGGKIQFHRLNHVTIAVPTGEHDRVRAFYGGVLGLKELERPEQLRAVYDIIWFECAGIQIHIDLTPPFTAVAGNRHFALEVVDLAGIRHYLEEKKVPIKEAVPLPDRNWFYLPDPFGNTIEFLEFK